MCSVLSYFWEPVRVRLRLIRGGYTVFLLCLRGGYFDLEKELALHMKVPRIRTQPSLVNRIGFYDEYYPTSSKTGDNSSYKQHIGITNWLTDPRFLFDAGSYWEDAAEYCLDADFNWIFDPNFDDEEETCCNPNSACAIRRAMRQNKTISEESEEGGEESEEDE